jgi:hypothetical protein
LVFNSRAQNISLIDIHERPIVCNLNNTQYNKIILIENLYCTSCLLQITNHLIKTKPKENFMILIIGNPNNVNDIALYKSIKNKFMFSDFVPKIYFIQKSKLTNILKNHSARSPSIYLINKKQYLSYPELFDNNLELNSNLLK